MQLLLLVHWVSVGMTVPPTGTNLQSRNAHFIVVSQKQVPPPSSTPGGQAGAVLHWLSIVHDVVVKPVLLVQYCPAGQSVSLLHVVLFGSVFPEAPTQIVWEQLLMNLNVRGVV